MPYELRFSQQFRKDLERLDSTLHRRILEALEKLRETPHQARKLAGVDIGRWRIRIGDYRVRYDIRTECRSAVPGAQARGHIPAALAAQAAGCVDVRAERRYAD